MRQALQEEFEFFDAMFQRPAQVHEAREVFRLYERITDRVWMPGLELFPVDTIAFVFCVERGANGIDERGLPTGGDDAKYRFFSADPRTLRFVVAARYES